MNHRISLNPEDGLYELISSLGVTHRFELYEKAHIHFYYFYCDLLKNLSVDEADVVFNSCCVDIQYKMKLDATNDMKDLDYNFWDCLMSEKQNWYGRIL